MKKVTIVFNVAMAVGLLLVPPCASADPLLPDFGAAKFVQGAPVSNPYFPMIDRRTRIFEGREEPGGPVVERIELTNLGPGPTILGVQTSIQLDRAFEEGLLVEETFDYFAQDTAGNVWYFGEDVTNYIYDDDGNLIGTNNESAWKAGINGALPGYIMPANPTVGFEYYQEFAALDDALDQAVIVGIGKKVTTGFGDFTNVLQILETTSLDPDAREFKYYAPGVGLILIEEGLDTNFENPEVRSEFVQAVPEPATIILLGTGLAGVCAAARKKRKQNARKPAQGF